jgi:ribosome biogenesis GTPase / thiamine phosphate phosphatase
VLSRTGGRYRVWLDGAACEAVLRGRMKRGDRDTVLVGDRVRLAAGAGTPAAIEAILPRTSLLQRRSPGRARGERPVAANVGQVVVVGAARMPDWDPHLIDRFIAVAEANRLPVQVVINKADLDRGAAAHGRPYAAAGYPVLVTCAVDGTGLDQLGASLEHRVTLFTGPTGVGKSSLLNALAPGLRLRTAAVSQRSHAGRHTTVAADMHPFGLDGFVVDTPGLRDIGLWGLSPQDVALAFPDLRRVAEGCRFDDCRHGEEPGCAVHDAVGVGTLAASRYESFRTLLAEADAASRPWA